MDANLIKKSVIDSYSKLAKATTGSLFSKLFACCDAATNANRVGEEIGYSKEELASVPEGANLGVGCGNPAALAKIKSGDRVIDLGSGAGFDAFLVSKAVGEIGEVIGVDLSDDMIQLAKRNALKGNYTNVRFVKGDIEDLPLQSQIADQVISNCVINLSLNKGKVFQEAYRVLKRGGLLSISDIVLERELPDFVSNSLAAHIACVSGAEKLDQYIGYIAEAGFKDIKIEKKTSFPIALMLADPQVRKLAVEMDFDLNSHQAKEIASSVVSISVSAKRME